MDQKVVILHKGFLAHYQIEETGKRSYQLLLLQFTGEVDAMLPKLIHLHYDLVKGWQADAGSKELIADLGNGVFSGRMPVGHV